MKSFATIITVLSFVCFGCSNEPAPSPEPEKVALPDESPQVVKPSFEIAGGIGLAIIDVDGLSKLDLDTKKIIFHLYRAALVADTIHESGRDPKELLTKKVFKGILAVEEEIPEPLKNKIIPYIKRELVAKRESSSTLKRPPFIPGELAAAANIALKRGMDLGIDSLEGVPLDANELERLEALLSVIRPLLFDYDAHEAPDADTAGRVEPKIGPEKQGLIVNYLKSGQALMPADESKALSHLIDYIETGNPESKSEFEKLFMLTDPKTIAVVGHSSVQDTSEAKASDFQAVIMLRDETMAGVIAKLTESSGYFAEQIKWDGKPVQKKQKSKNQTARVYQLVAARGASNRNYSGEMVLQGSLSFSYNYLDEDFFLVNLRHSLQRNLGAQIALEYSIDDVVKERRLNCLDQVQDAHFLLSRVVARQLVPLEDTSRQRESLGSLFDTVLEVHANLAALYFAFDPQMQELNLLSNPECARALLDGYLSTVVEQLIWMENPGVLPDPVMQARQVVFANFVEKGVARLVQTDGKYYAGVVDYDALKVACKELLDETNRILLLGDAKAAEALLAMGLVPVDESLRSNVRSRYDALGLPRIFAVLNPVLEAVLDDKDNLVDLTVSKTETLKDHLKVAVPNY